MSGFKLDDYIDVAERIRLFIEKYPDGTLQGEGEFVRDDVGAIIGYVYKARAYRHPEDLRPGIGTAFEPIPGKTPYTKDSEVMNAETSAWGRAIIAAGIPSKKIASADEVRNRSSEPPAGDSQSSGMGGSEGSMATGARADSQAAGSRNGKRKPEQLAYLAELLATLKNTQPGTDWASEARHISVKFFGKEHSKDLTKQELDSLVAEVERWIAQLEPADVPFG